MNAPAAIGKVEKIRARDGNACWGCAGKLDLDAEPNSKKAPTMHEAASRPEMFARILQQFGGRLPSADDAIRAFLIRHEGFSTGGANDLIKTLRDTYGDLPELPSSEEALAEKIADEGPQIDTPDDSSTSEQASHRPAVEPIGELISLPLGQNAKAELRLIGSISATSYARLIRHLELLRDMAAEEQSSM